MNRRLVGVFGFGACLFFSIAALGEESESAAAKADPPPSYSTTVRSAPAPRSAAEATIEQNVISAAPRTGATDLLRLVPGLVVSQHGGEGKAQQLFLRGFDAVHGQDVEVIVGGLPVNEVSHVHALGYADLNFVIPEAVRNIVVQEGSYLASQGDFAVAGTLRFNLGLAEPGWLVSGSLGQFGNRRLVTGFQSRTSDDSFGAVELAKGDGFGVQRAFARASALAQTAFELNGAKVRILGGSYATRFDSPSVVRLDDFEAGRMGLFDSYSIRAGGSASRHQLLAEIEWPRVGEGRTKVTSYVIRSDLRLRQNYTGFAKDDRGDGLEQRHGATTMGLALEHRRNLDAWGHTVGSEVGLGGRTDLIDQDQRPYRETDGLFFSPNPVAGQRDREFAANVNQTDIWGYGELSTSFGKWDLRIGTRIDALAVRVADELAFVTNRSKAASGYERSAFGFHVGAKGGISRAVGEHTRLFLSYGDGFRTPQARSLSEGENAPFVNVRTGELGARWHSQRVLLTTSLFSSYVANDVFFDHTIGTTSYIGETVRGGLTFAGTFAPSERWILSTSGSVADAVVLKDCKAISKCQLPGFAPIVLRGDGGYQRPFSIKGRSLTAIAGLGLTFVGPRVMRFNEFSEPYFLADVRVGVRWKAATLRLDVKNVLNSQWRDGEYVYASHFNQDPTHATSERPVRHFMAGAPRTAWLALEFHL